METYILLALIIIIICGISSRVDKIDKKLGSLNNNDFHKNINDNFIENSILNDYICKKVEIEVINDDIENSYMFDSFRHTEGYILEYDNIWLSFKYYNKEKKSEVIQYFRRRDIKSINEIK